MHSEKDRSTADSATTELASGEAKSVLVNSKLLWNHTGVRLVAGGRYKVTVSSGQTWKDADIVSGPGGQSGNWFQRLFFWTKRVVPANWFALIGATNRDLQDAFVYVEGADNEYAPRSAGELLMFANDAWFAYGNNSGSLTVVITRLS